MIAAIVMHSQLTSPRRKLLDSEYEGTAFIGGRNCSLSNSVSCPKTFESSK
jgi:hypothetical protein